MKGSSKLVPFDRARRRPDPARVEEFASTARKLQREREASSELVERMLRVTPPADWPRLAALSSMHSSGVVERLGQEVDARLDREPREALVVAELATAIADVLPPESYPAITLAQTRAHAWKDRGQALCYLSRYDDALRALDHAEAQLAPFGTLAHDLAIVRFVRATVLQHRREFEIAEALLVECRDVFQDHGDTRRHAKCTLALGNLRVRRGDYRAAREVLVPLLGSDDPLREATARLALGWCAIHLDEPEQALLYFSDAANLHRRTGRHMEAARATTAIGTAFIRLGQLERALSELRSARDELTQHQLVEAAGLTGLEIVEVYMLQGEIDDATALAADLVREFTDAGLNRRAIAALAYLKDAIAASTATPEVVRDVHAYITSLRSNPACEFAHAN